MSTALRPSIGDLAHDAPASEQAPGGRVRLVARAVLVLLVVWGVVAVLYGLRSVDELREARAAVMQAETALADGDLVRARDMLAIAGDRAGRAASRLATMPLVPLRPLPVAGPNLTAATEVSGAVRDVSRDAVTVLDAVISVSRSAADGAELGTDLLAALGPPLRSLADTLTATSHRVAATASPELVGPVADARSDYLAMVEPTREQAVVAADVAEQLPVLLGADRPQRYLVMAASLSELRGSGGLLGSWSVVTADAGRLTFAPFEGIDELESGGSSDVAAPNAEHAGRYARSGALRFWRNANLSSDFPAGAEVMLALWEAGGRPRLDGVIMADTVVFERLVERSGPIEVPGVTTLTAATTREFVGLEAYGAFDTHDERKAVLGSVAAAAFERLAGVIEGEDVRATLGVLADLTRNGNVRIYSRDAEVQSALAGVGATGALDDAPGEFAAVVVNNVAANKVDYFTSRTIEHRVELLPDGVTAAELDVTFRNEAPQDGLPAYVIGPSAEGVGPGDNLSEVTVLCGIACDVTEAPEAAVGRGTERGHPATDVRVLVPAGGSRSLALTTRTSDGWRQVDGGAELVVRHRRQPTLTDDLLRIVVRVPDGAQVSAMPPGARRDGDELIWESSGGHSDIELRFHFEAVAPR